MMTLLTIKFGFLFSRLSEYLAGKMKKIDSEL